MITGFNPTDMYAVDHIRRVLTTFPGVFSGIGEFTIHKEFVSVEDRRRDGEPHQPRARPHPRLRRRGRPGRASFTTTSTCRFPKPDQEPYQLVQLRDAVPASSADHDHLGAHRARDASCGRSQDQIDIIERADLESGARACLTSISPGPRPRSTSWRRPESFDATAALINRHPDRFLFGTDEVAPTDQASYLDGLRHVRRRCSRVSPPRRARNCGRGITSACSTRPGAGSAHGNRPTSRRHRQ